MGEDEMDEIDEDEDDEFTEEGVPDYAETLENVPTCPYCRYKDEDYEYNIEDGFKPTKCTSCDKEIVIGQIIVFSTWKKDIYDKFEEDICDNKILKMDVIEMEEKMDVKFGLELVEGRQKVIDQKVIEEEELWKELFDSYPKCVHQDCDEYVDRTPGMGIDTTCPYHRLLWNGWMYEVLIPTYDDYGDILDDVERRRKLHSEWIKEVGEEECDRIVNEMAQDPLNWEC